MTKPNTRTPKRKKDPDRQEKREEEYEHLLNNAKNLLLTVLGAFIAYLKSARLIEAVKTGTLDTEILLPPVLVVLTMGLGLLWLISAEHEFGLMKRYMAKFIPEKMLSAVVLSYAIPLFVILLVYLCDHPSCYALLFWLYITFDMLASGTMRRIIATAFRRPTAEMESAAYKAIYAYYVGRPFEMRGYMMGTLSLTAFFCAVLHRYGQHWGLNAIVATRFEIASYSLLIATIVLGEISVWLWRRVFYAALDEDAA